MLQFACGWMHLLCQHKNTCICINKTLYKKNKQTNPAVETLVCGPLNTHEPCTYAHTARSYALGQLKLLPVLCLLHHKKVTAWFMHLFCELDGNCLCSGAPDRSKREIWKWNSVHELIYRVEQVLKQVFKLPSREQLDKCILSCLCPHMCVCVVMCIPAACSMCAPRSRTCLRLQRPVMLRRMIRSVCKPTFAYTQTHKMSSHDIAWVFACVCSHC